jgi:membrane-bound metal-dependent hydrolase YbcI (DUF457 family)
MEQKLGEMVIFSGKMHFQFAVIVWILLQVGVDHEFLNPIPFLIGTMVPDCDHRKAPMGRILPLWLFFRHRGFTHSLVALALFSGLVSLYDLKWGILFAGGYFLHLMMDSGTPSGIAWLLGKKKARS